MGQSRSTELNRRKYLSALAAAGGASIAGCLGDDGDDDNGNGDEGLGERVPELTYEFSTGLGSWSEIEQDTAEIASSNMEELGLNVEPVATEAFTYWEHIEFDTRDADLYAGGFAPEPGGYDPQFFMGLYHLQYAGDQAGLNQSQYYSCEYAELMHDQFFADSIEEREELIQEALEVFSDDIPEINTFPVVGYTAANEDRINIDEDLHGDMGMSIYNHDWVTQVETEGGEDLRWGVENRILNTNVHTQIEAPTDAFWWSTTLYSPLMCFDRNEEIVPNLAEEVDISDETSTFTFSLREDATFHDGEPVTADDVVFTMELFNNEYAIIGGADAGWEYVEAVDDHTVEFSFDHSRPTFMMSMELYLFGIVPEHIWGEYDVPEVLPELSLDNDEIVGSGPYEMVEWEQDTILHLTPNEDHWATPNQDLLYIGHADTQSMYRSFQEDNLDIIPPGGGMMGELEQEDGVWTSRDVGMSIGCISPQVNTAPGKFREFRLALSQCIDRREANEVAAYGDSEEHLHSAPIAPDHPWYPEDHEGLKRIAESPEGDVDIARETLEEEGWGWDDDGNLHYPEDADLTPSWEQGSSPLDEPENFPCAEDIPENYPS